MIQFERFELPNGLRVLVHQDASTPMVSVNIMYDVGARDEDPEKTGFAHLFEHLMFGGSVHIPDYDAPLQRAGGESNAYTSNDLTDYYVQLPAQNLETAFWLESDRMLSLAFSEKSLDVQRKVVCEEFKETYINKPYGNVWHLLRPLTYKVHPYSWMTIGKELPHIENAKLEDVKKFFQKHYCPANAVLVVAGNVTTSRVRELAEKWFAGIPSGQKYKRQVPAEPEQEEERLLEYEADVPHDALYKCWHIPGRLDPAYHAIDLLTDILSGGGSSRLFQSLVKEQQLFSSVKCYQTGNIDPGLVVLQGNLSEGVSMQAAEAAVEEQLQKIKNENVSNTELQKVKNNTESMIVFEDISIMNRANSLAYYELLGDASMMNKETEKYAAVTAADILEESNRIFRAENCSTLHYFANKASTQS